VSVVQVRRDCASVQPAKRVRWAEMRRLDECSMLHEVKEILFSLCRQGKREKKSEFSFFSVFSLRQLRLQTVFRR
jgi:hypothetical protein